MLSGLHSKAPFRQGEALTRGQRATEELEVAVTEELQSFAEDGEMASERIWALSS